MARVVEGIGAMDLHFPGTKLDHQVRAAINDQRSARKRIGKLQEEKLALEARLISLEDDLTKAREAFQKVGERLEALKERKDLEEPGQPVKTPHAKAPRGFGLQPEAWHMVRQAGPEKVAQLEVAYKEGRVQEWWEEFLQEEYGKEG